MNFEIFVLFMTIAAALAGTNVNISFTQQHSRTVSKISELQNDKVQLKETDSLEKFDDDKNSRSARIQLDEKKFDAEIDNSSKLAMDITPTHDAAADYRTERVQSEEREGFFGSHSQNQQRSFYKPNREVHTVQGQLRNLSPQDKQNMEFERYIQNYHSGPTVETVYESAKPEMQHTLPASSIQERSQRVVKFEKQVALPAKADSVQPSTDAVKPITNHHVGASSNTISLASTSSSTSPSPSSLPPVIPSASVSSSSGNNFKVNLNQKPSSVGKDEFNFDLNYNKPNYNEPTFQYKDEHTDAHFYNQFPPSVEEPQNGYGDYYNNIYSRQQVMEGYHPNEQRPVVTKTIQIAQPAIKAKKYEVRHPAIQKEFYDIEERVVIKPAGTVVVELERPSAKILKEETTLPLGHPHPAVAASYMQNRNSPTFSNIIYSNAGSSSSSHSNNQYIPRQTYVESASTAYDQNAKGINAETNQNKPFIGESRYTASTANSPKQQSREIVVLTDGHGNQRQLSNDQFAYTREEANKNPSRTVFNHRNSFAYEDNGRSNAQTNISPQRTGYQVTHDNREDFSFDAEYISNSGNLRKESKPARLQEIPSERVIEQEQPPQPIIKHEHKIVLSPSQHNIYLSRNQETPTTKFIGETAEVREIKPYIQNHRGPVVVYAPSKQVSESKYSQRSEYNIPSRHNAPQRSMVSGTENRVQYSDPYAQMRHNADEDETQSDQQNQKHISSQSKKSENLVLEDKPITEVEKSSKENSMGKQLAQPQAHIEIKIPDSPSNDANKAIFVSSTIRPMIMDFGHGGSQNSKLEISVTNNGEPKKEKYSENEHNINSQVDSDNENENKTLSEKESENLSNIKIKPDCDQISKSMLSENYETAPEQKFLRIVEASSATPSSNDAATSAEASAIQSNLQPHNVDINVKSSAGHISPAGSRVIASTAVPKESSPSESFHKRRIVVNHPFQTVREVVEHEPYTNYHEVQVREPATPALYHSANYYKPHGAPHQSETRNSPAYYS